MTLVQRDIEKVDDRRRKRRGKMEKKKLLSVFAAAALFLSCFTAVPAVSRAEGQSSLQKESITSASLSGKQMLRLYNIISGEHFYTENPSERDNLVSVGWNDEGTAWTAPVISDTPVYRLYNPNAGGHHYTLSADEKDILISLGWNDEGIGWYSDDNEGIPLYRLYNPNATGQKEAGGHHYTKDIDEVNDLVAAGWEDEGIGWYGCDDTSSDEPEEPGDTPTSPSAYEPPLPEDETTGGEDSFVSTYKADIEEFHPNRRVPALKAVNGVEPYSKYWTSWDSIIDADLSKAPGLCYSLTISDITSFSNESYAPNGYDKEKLIEWGKDPGLGVNILKEQGYTGKGAVIAYIDQPIMEHEQYSDEKTHYFNDTGSDNSMHGPTVLSFLKGKDTGTAPDAEVYFYANPSWLADQTTHAKCLYQVIEQNKSLPEGKKIRMVGFSDNIDLSEKNAEAFETAVKACEDAGIMVWFCGDYGPMTFIPYSDKNNFDNLITGQWWGEGSPADLVFVPSAGRTSAATLGGANYIYWGDGGLSWTMPYALGVYADAIAIDPSLTKEDIMKLIVDTAYVNEKGQRIINPVNFIATVLKGVGRKSDAKKLLKAAENDKKYMYAVMNSDLLSSDDISAIRDYLSDITDRRVLLVDAKNIPDAKNLYAILKKDKEQRGGQIAGIQIFGLGDMVPSFNIDYKAQMTSGIDEAGTFLSDLFYGNFENTAESIADGYSVYDHLKNNKSIRLTPKWPVVRLPLSKGEYSAFFEKYDDFAGDTGLCRLDTVNFSNPIFASNYHSDDMGAFLNRAKDEFKILNSEFRLYGNKKGEYPVTTEVLGGFEKTLLKKENQKGSCEFIINSHGQRNNIDNAFFEDGEEKRESFINSDTINKTLNSNAYYLDVWTCHNGNGMKDNLTTTALKGDCVGMFSATHLISNNGVRYDVTVEDMQKSNFYYFYYSYLKALDAGETRSDAFFEAQKSYGKALNADKDVPLRGDGNVQFNMYNLLDYHNFGVIEPNPAAVVWS